MKATRAQQSVRAHVKRASILQGGLEIALIAPRVSSSRLLGSRRAMPAQLVNLRARTALLVTPVQREPTSKIARYVLLIFR